MKKLLAVLALVACSSPIAPPPPLLKFPSSIEAIACPTGYKLAATWQVPSGDLWQARFFAVNAETHDSTTTSGATTQTSRCVFSSGQIVYAVLVGRTVLANNDMTQLITLK